MRGGVAFALVASGIALGVGASAAAVALVEPGSGATDARPTRSADPPQRAPEAERDAPEPAPSEGSPYALVDAIAEAEQADPQRLAGALDAVRRLWEGHTYTWQARVLPALCSGPERCVVLPLDHARLDEPVAHGWLPELALEPADYRALERACAPHDACVVRFEATLAELRLSPDVPTALTFDDVDIAGAREARPDESWVRQRRDAR